MTQSQFCCLMAVAFSAPHMTPILSVVFGITFLVAAAAILFVGE